MFYSGSRSRGARWKDEGGSPLPWRPFVDAVGSGIAVTDDAANGKTVLTASGGAGGITVADEGSALTSRGTLNFIGPGVSAADNPGAGRTDVTIPGGGNSTSQAFRSGVYGAVGDVVWTTGSPPTLAGTDSTTALQTWLNAAAVGLPRYAGSGTLAVLDSPITGGQSRAYLSDPIGEGLALGVGLKTGFHILGEGQLTAIFKRAAYGSWTGKPLLKLETLPGNVIRPTVERISLLGANAYDAGYGLHMSYTWYGRVRDCFFFGHEKGMYLTGAGIVDILDLECQACTVGIDIVGDTGYPAAANHINIDRPVMNSCDTGIKLVNGAGLHIRDGDFEGAGQGATTIAIDLGTMYDSGHPNVVEGCYFEGVNECVHVRAGAATTILRENNSMIVKVDSGFGASSQKVIVQNQPSAQIHNSASAGAVLVQAATCPGYTVPVGSVTTF